MGGGLGWTKTGKMASSPSLEEMIAQLRSLHEMQNLLILVERTQDMDISLEEVLRGSRAR